MDDFRKLNSSSVQSSSSSLSSDLLIEILLRLPLKTLARFKCVSKAWREVISDTRFQARLPVTMSGLFYQNWEINLGEVGFASISNEIPHTDINLRFLPSYPQLRLMDSCNGLLLFLHGSALPPTPYVYHGSFPPHPDVFFVCNPITRRWVSLPESPKINRWMDCFLMFNPHNSSHFTVIRIGSVSSSCLQLSVFHSEKRKWINSSITTSIGLGFLTSKGIVSADGIVYRLAFPRYLLKINIREQSCVDIELPEKSKGFPCFRLYGRNLLCALFCGPSQLQIWELKESDAKDQWVLKHCNSIEALIKPRFGWSGMVKILALHLELDIVYLGFSNKIISYRFNDGSMEVIFSFARNFDLGWGMKVYPFVPCILNCFDEAPLSSDRSCILDRRLTST